MMRSALPLLALVALTSGCAVSASGAHSPSPDDALNAINATFTGSGRMSVDGRTVFIPSGTSDGKVDIPLWRNNPMTPGNRIRASADAIVIGRGVNELAPCGTRTVQARSYAQLEIVSGGNVVARSARARGSRWQQLRVSFTAVRLEPVHIVLLTGYSGRSVTYSSFRGAACVRTTVPIFATGAITPPAFDIRDPLKAPSH